MDQRPKLKNQNCKALREENRGTSWYWIWWWFLAKSTGNKEKVGNLNFIKMNKFCVPKDTIRRGRSLDSFTEWEKVFAHRVSGEDWHLGIQRTPTAWQQWKQHNPKVGKGLKKTFLRRRYYTNGQQTRDSTTTPLSPSDHLSVPCLTEPSSSILSLVPCTLLTMVMMVTATLHWTPVGCWSETVLGAFRHWVLNNFEEGGLIAQGPQLGHGCPTPSDVWANAPLAPRWWKEVADETS